jgi:hypothetical protein
MCIFVYIGRINGDQNAFVPKMGELILRCENNKFPLLLYVKLLGLGVPKHKNLIPEWIYFGCALLLLVSNRWLLSFWTKIKELSEFTYYYLEAYLRYLGEHANCNCSTLSVETTRCSMVSVSMLMVSVTLLWFRLMYVCVRGAFGCAPIACSSSVRFLTRWMLLLAENFGGAFGCRFVV